MIHKQSSSAWSQCLPTKSEVHVSIRSGTTGLRTAKV